MTAAAAVVLVGLRIGTGRRQVIGGGHIGGDLKFGIAGLLWTTVIVSAIAMVLAVPISIGIARAEGQGDTAEQLLHRADQALYRAKRTGRNKVVSDAA